MYPYVSLREITIDPELARRLPRRLAYYHLAIPIAEDDEYITVALAFSDNKWIISVLKQVLKAQVIPVRADETEIKHALDQVWQQTDSVDNVPSPAAHVVGWGETDSTVPWLETFTDQVATAYQATSTVLSDPAHHPQNKDTDADTDLIITAQSSQLKALLTPQFPSVLLLRPDSQAPRIHKMLCVLRGHSPDRSVLRWIIPLAKHYGAEVHLLAGVPETILGQGMTQYANLLNKNTPSGAHLLACRQMLRLAQINGRVHIRQGMLEASIAEAVEEGGYDLIGMAVEAYGEFVSLAVDTLQTRSPNHHSALLLVKP